jgi:hypothetical protein
MWLILPWRVAFTKTVRRSLRNRVVIAEAAFQRRRRGFEQQSQSHREKSYGFRTFRCLELALYHSLGKLPEPESGPQFSHELPSGPSVPFGGDHWAAAVTTPSTALYRGGPGIQDLLLKLPLTSTPNDGSAHQGDF